MNHHTEQFKIEKVQIGRNVKLELTRIYSLFLILSFFKHFIGNLISKHLILGED